MNTNQNAGQPFDLESAPDIERAKELMPAFEAEDVKLGNLKDKAKIDEKINEARENHEKNWLDKSALRPETAKVVAIGYYHFDKGYSITSIKNMGSEKELIEDFWWRLNDFHKSTGKPLIGHNIAQFDLPMLIIRSRILDIPVPAGIFKGRYLDSNRFVDIRNEWLMGRDYRETKSSLDYIAKALGVKGKNGDGKRFHELLERDEIEAYAYLHNDVRIVKEVSQKLGMHFDPTTETFEEWKQKYLKTKPANKVDNLEEF